MRIRVLLPALTLVIAASSALGQEAVDLERPLDQTVDDRGGLARSLREIDPGLRVPSGFEHVYRVPGRDDLLMRINGGLYAVFPASRYRVTRGGAIALIPNDTVFHIGPPEVALPSPFAPDADAGEDDASGPEARPVVPPGAGPSDLELHAVPPDARPARWSGRLLRPDGATDRPATPRSVANDERYRARRARELIERAAAAERALYERAPGRTPPVDR